MGAYIEFFKRSFLQQYAYRINSFIQIASSMLKLFVQVSVWSALYHNTGEINGISLQDMISFLIINLIITSIANTNIGNQIGQRVSEGTIGIDFIRPVSFKFYLISEDMGAAFFKILFNVLPVCIFASLFWGVQFPARLSHIILFAVSMILGIALMYQIDYVLGLLAFWFKTAFYMEWFSRAFFELFAGTFVPLWFYPHVLYKISQYLPFRYVLFDPISIYLEKVSTGSANDIILVQLIWILLLQLIEYVMWNQIRSIVTVHGG